MGSPFDKLNSIKSSNDKNINSDNNQTINNMNNNNNQNNNIQNNNTNQNNNQQTNLVQQNPNTIKRTNANSIRVSSGVHGFDKIINGGFIGGSVNLLSGGPGTGKTIFALQFILEGIMLYNEPGIFISFDEKKENVFENMKSIGWNLESFEKSGKLHFVEYSPEQLIKILNEGGGLLDNLMSKTDAKRVVLDSISSFLLINSSEFGKRELLRSFFKLLKKWDVTTLLTNEYSPMTGNEMNQETQAVFFEVDSMIQMHYTHEKLGMERSRLIEVYKMRGTNHLTKAVPYKILKNGIQIIQ